MNIRDAWEFYLDVVTLGPIAMAKGQTHLVAVGTDREADALKFALEENGINAKLMLGTTDGGVYVKQEDVEEARWLLEGGMKNGK